MALHENQPLTQGLDIYGPIERARRCLDSWLKEESRHLPEMRRRRVAALMARYFHYESDVNDQLMFSFLRHYGGHREIDMDDPSSVRMEIKELLDTSVPCSESFLARTLRAAAIVSMVAFPAYFVWDAAQWKITPEQQATLKAQVEKIVTLDAGVTSARVWSKVKKPLEIRSYHHISYWHYDDAREMLDKWLKDLESGAGM